MSGGGRAEDASRSSTALLVRRPILAFVINTLIVLAGLAAFFAIDIRELPEVDSPVVSVRTSYPGAAPETVDREVTAEIEGAAGRVSGVNAISSTSRFGDSRVTVEFRDSVDLDTAATDMRDAIARVTNSLPDEAEAPRVIKADSNADAVMRISVTSSSRSPQELTRIVEDTVEDRLLAAPGVADVQIYGDRQPVFRVDVDQIQLASRRLTVADVAAHLQNVALDAPAGAMTSDRQSILVRATAAINTVAGLEALEIAPEVRLGDVAQVTLGPETGQSILRANGETGIGIGIIRAAQSSTLAISDAVNGVVTQLRGVLPDDVRIFVSSDDAVFIRGAMHEVEIALGISVVIVTLIIYLFLGDLRATMIPVLAIPVSLIGTVAAIWMAGFSINILTLLALVLATGLVVDDAIVVLENIVRRRGQGMGARAAAVLGTQQVFFAVVATTTTLAAVFIPLSFLPGQTGGLFREFGFTLAISVLLSSITALTFCPVLASRMLRAEDAAPRRGITGWLGEVLAALFGRMLRGALAMPWAVLAAATVIALTALFLSGGIKRELTPPEDRALILLSVSAPQGVSLDYTNGKMRAIEDRIQPLRDSGEIRATFAIAGSGGQANRGFMVMALADWADRERSQQAIADDIRKRLSDIVGIRAVPIQPNSLGIRGAGRGLSFAVVGNDYGELAASARQLVERMQDDPAFGTVQLGYDLTQAQLFIQVDRARAADLGVNIDGLGEALQAVLDGRTVGKVYQNDDSFDIKLVSSRNPVNDPGDLERIFVRAGDGEMIPISSFVSLEERPVAPELNREAQMRSVPITASLSPELALGDAWTRAQGLARDVLPPDSRIVPLAEAKTLSDSTSGILVTFAFAIVIVFLVLAAQFESFVSAVIVMATVPFGLACAIFALLFTGGSLNVYSQIGLVLLVGIMAKNGILIVEFANQLRDEGASVRRAIEDATMIRLRPVMMTMVATVMGGVPLVLAFGAGAEARAVLGWIIVGGLGLATFATLFITPVAYLLLAGLSKPKAAEEARLQSELDRASNLAES